MQLQVEAFDRVLTPKLAAELGREYATLKIFHAYEHIRRGGHPDHPVFRAEHDATYDLARLLSDEDAWIGVGANGEHPLAMGMHLVLVDEMHDTNRAMFTVLRDCGALVRLLPEVDCLWGVPQSVEHHPEVDTGAHLMLVLDMAARLNASLPVRFACLTHDLGKGSTPADVLPRHIGHEQRSVRLLKALCERLRVPVECKELAEVVAREHGNIHRSADLNAGAIVRLLERCDAFRKPARFADILLACECDARGRLGLHDAPYPQAPRLALALQLALSVATNTIATAAQAAGASGPKIGEWIHKARVAAVTAGL